MSESHLARVAASAHRPVCALYDAAQCPAERCTGWILTLTWPSTSPVLRPVFGVFLGVLTEDVALDRIELDETTHARRLVGAVEQDPPRRPRAQAAPRQLRRRVADGKSHRAARDRERVGLVDVQRPTREEVI